MLNTAVLIGRLTRKPELRYTSSGTPVGGFTLAVDRPFKNAAGERETDFIDIVVWRNLAETCANHLGKGRLVAVQGRIQGRSYETDDGQKRRVVEVIADQVRFLDWPKNGQDNRKSNQAVGADSSGAEEEFGFPEMDPTEVPW